MELYDLVALFTVLGVVSGIIIVLIFRIIPQKSPKKQAESELIRLQKAYSSTVEEIIQRKDAQIKSVNSENNRLRKELLGNEGEEDSGDVPWEVISAGAQQAGIPAAMLLPFKKQILQYTKGMSVDEIQQLGTQLKQLMGSKGPQQNSQEQSNSTQFA